VSVFLVSGGAGFIGSHIVERLVKDGHKVRVLDNLITGKKDNLSSCLEKIEFFEGDIRDDNVLKKSVSGCEYVLHQAALRSVPKSILDPLGYHDANVTGTLKLLLAARDAKIKRFVLASSSSVYGDVDKFPEREDFLAKPISPYAATKLLDEYYCYLFSQAYELETVSLRYFNVFGPRQSLESLYAIVVPKFIDCIIRGEACPVHGDGLQRRDFTFVDNVVEANILAATTNNQVSGQTFNVASGKDYSVLDLIKLLNKILGKDVKPNFIDKRPGDVMRTSADISKAKRLLGYSTKVHFEEGLKKTVEYFKTKGFK